MKVPSLEDKTPEISALRQSSTMLSNLAKALAFKSSLASRTAQPLAKYVATRISTYLNTPRVYPERRPAATRPRTRRHRGVNSTSSWGISNHDSGRVLGEPGSPIIIDGLLGGILFFGVVAGVTWTAKTCSEKYCLLKKARGEWDANFEQERVLAPEEKGGSLSWSDDAQNWKDRRDVSSGRPRTSSTEGKGGSLSPSDDAQYWEDVWDANFECQRTPSTNTEMEDELNKKKGSSEEKWAWIMQRASELEQEAKHRVEKPRRSRQASTDLDQ